MDYIKHNLSSHTLTELKVYLTRLFNVIIIESLWQDIVISHWSFILLIFLFFYLFNLLKQILSSSQFLFCITHVSLTQNRAWSWNTKLTSKWMDESNMSSSFSAMTNCCSVSSSGKRKITLVGSHLEFVKEVSHSHTIKDVKLLRNSSYQVGV